MIYACYRFSELSEEEPEDQQDINWFGLSKIEENELGIPTIEEIDVKSPVTPCPAKGCSTDENGLNSFTNSDISTLKLKSSNSLLKPSTDCNKAKRRDRFRKMKIKSEPVYSMGGLSDKLNYFITDDFILLERLGIGTYGEVHKAIRKSDNLEVALKVAKGNTAIRYLQKESSILCQFDNSHFPKFYELIDEQRLNEKLRESESPVTASKSYSINKAYLVMEYIQGKDLEAVLNEGVILSSKQALANLKVLVSAVKLLHENHIAHRDIKPGNIMITEDKKTKLIDFNTSKQSKVKDSVWQKFK